MTSENPLECWRAENNVSVVTVAKLLCVSRKTWYQWIGGCALPQEAQAKKIEAVTGVTRLALLGWAQEQVLPPSLRDTSPKPQVKNGRGEDKSAVPA